MIIFVADTTSKYIVDELALIGQVITISKNLKTYEAIANHPDIQIIAIEDTLFIDMETYNLLNPTFRDIIEQHSNYHILQSELGRKYPASVPFNGRYLNNVFIHNLKYTDPYLLQWIKGREIDCYHVEQGYTGCNLLYMGDRKGITSDKGIAKRLRHYGFEILLIKEGYIRLPGFDHGFIGGCSGVVGKHIYFNGKISDHPDYLSIERFILNNGFRIVEDVNMPLTDCGSILVL